ncbi:MAG: hypothetical protein M3256_02100 [Actinomycetota bacterium]|nr:hypothetical protein [Actinomycetota bacterium]
MAEDRFETRLKMLSRDVVWPPTPDFTAELQGRLTAVPQQGHGWRRREMALALAAAFLIGLALLVLPPTRQAIAGWLGLTHVTVQRVRVLPSPAPSSVIDGSRMRVGLAEARSRVAFTVLTPPTPADAIYLVEGPPGGEVQFELPGGVLVTEAGGSFDQRILGKVIGPGTEVSSVEVRGRPGAWIHGLPHEVVYFDRSGNFRPETLRLSGDVLIWDEAGVVLRVEGSSSEGMALAVAASLR